MFSYKKFAQDTRALDVQEHYCYFKGNMAQARELNPEVNKIAKVAYKLYELDYVRLYQVRKDAGELGYVMHYYLVPLVHLGERFYGAVNHQEGNFKDAELSSDF